MIKQKNEIRPSGTDDHSNVLHKKSTQSKFSYLLSAICLFKHACASLVVHLARIREEQPAHRLARV